MKRLSGFERLRPRAPGVTLIELIVVVTIVGILTAIAVPSYMSYTTRTHRSAAKSCLSDFAQVMERYYTTNLTYVGATATLACQSDSGMGDWYTFAATNLAQQTYTVTATPIGAQAIRDAKCGSLSVDQAGLRTVSGSGGTSYCW